MEIKIPVPIQYRKLNLADKPASIIKSAEKKCKTLENIKAFFLPKAAGIDFKFFSLSNSSSCNA